MQEVLKFFRENPTFYLATVEGDQPRVRPFGAVAEFEGRLSLTTGNGKKVYAQLLKNPKIELFGMDAQGTWLRVEAEAVADDRREARKAMLDQNPSLRDLYSEDDGVMAVLFLRNATAVFASFTAEPKVVKF